MLNRRPTLRDLFADDPMARIVSPSAPADADLGAELTEAPPPAEDAPLAEGGTFDAKPVPVLEPGFTHFVDGAQRSWRAMFHGMYPVTLAHTSAALLRRMDRQVEPPSASNYRGGLEAYVPAVEGLAEKLRQIAPTASIPVAEDDTGLAIALRMKKEIEAKRKEREMELCEGFRDGRLLVDGGLGEVMERVDEETELVGLVKSHQRQYFKSRDRQLTILNLKEGERTAMFVRESTGRQGKACYSFYLKLREGQGQGPLFGLARVEVPATERNLRQADAIAGWILAERAPLSLPDPRFHVLLYPIHLVEEHLKARQPSEAAIRGLLGI
ncbi:MAG TPA: hypothetical protein VGE01_06355 [Fimbriimonas sp.]